MDHTPSDPPLIPELSPLSDIYIDESSQTRHRFLVLGGIRVPTRLVSKAEQTLAVARMPELPLPGEMKWTKVSNNKLHAYKRVVDTFFDHDLFRSIEYHSVVVDTTKQNHALHNEGSREIGFNKELFQLALKFARLYPTDLFHVYPDYRDTDQRPNKLRDMLNFDRRNQGDRRDWPYRRCHFRDSKTTPFLQLTDILTGALAYRINGHNLVEGASESKTRLSNWILRRAKVSDATRDTAHKGKFTIWHRQLQLQKGVPRR